MSADPHVIRVNRHNWNGQAAHIRATLMTWEWRWKQAEAAGRVVIDFRNVEFMEPWALSMFAAYALELRRRGVTVEIQLDAEANPANRYLESMGLNHVLTTGESTTHWDDSDQNTGLHVIRRHQDVTRFLGSIAAWGQGPTADVLDALKYGMAELGRNVVQHARSQIGGVAIAQYFPNQHAVQIAICDAGRGVAESLRPNYPELRGDLEALKLAVLPHVSGAGSPGPYGSLDNAGLGLFFCKEICWRTGGSFWIASNDALVGIRDNDSSGRNRVYRHINAWPGTLVTMHLASELTAEFSETLGVCRELSHQARTDAAGAGLDFVDDESEFPPDAVRVPVDEFLEDVEKASDVRTGTIRPAIERGDIVVLDFGGTRFVTQSFVHALLHDVFAIRGSLTKLIFRRCTKSTEEAIRLVAAYSAATYRQLNGGN